MVENVDASIEFLGVRVGEDPLTQVKLTKFSTEKVVGFKFADSLLVSIRYGLRWLWQMTLVACHVNLFLCLDVKKKLMP